MLYVVILSFIFLSEKHINACSLVQIFVRMSPYNLGRASCVCRKWRYAIRNPLFWRNACLKAWQVQLLNFFVFWSIYSYLTLLICFTWNLIFCWSFLEWWTTTKYYSQNMKGHGERCGFLDQECELMVIIFTFTESSKAEEL